MRVAIAGGHGKIALRLSRLLRAEGDEVLGLIRDPAQSEEVRAAGAEPVVCDLEGECDVAAAIGEAEAVVFAAGAGPGSGAERKRSMDLGGAVKLIEAARSRDLGRYVMVSAMGAADPLRRAVTSSASICEPRRKPIAPCARAASSSRSSAPDRSPTIREAVG